MASADGFNSSGKFTRSYDMKVKHYGGLSFIDMLTDNGRSLRFTMKRSEWNKMVADAERDAE